MSLTSEPSATRTHPAAVPFVVQEMERVEAPSPEVFARDYRRASRPAVLTGLTKNWRSLEQWTFQSMAQDYGDARVIAASLNDGKLADDTTNSVVFKRVMLREFVESASRPGNASLYVMAPTWNFPEAFQRDYRLPVYCEGAASMRAKVWLGKAGTVTPMHRDVPHNLHVHLSGNKRWLLFPPGGAGMYSRGLFSGMPNFSHVDPEQVNQDRFPKFRGFTALGATLGPGETLFIPHGWWHHTRTTADAVAMNFWWGGTWIKLGNVASTMFKRLRGLRRDEWG